MSSDCDVQNRSKTGSSRIAAVKGTFRELFLLSPNLKLKEGQGGNHLFKHLFSHVLLKIIVL